MINQSYHRQKCIIVLLFFVSFHSVKFVSASNSEVDSLKNLVLQKESAFDKAVINLQLAKLHERIDFEKGKQYARNAFVFENDSLMAEAANQLGRFFFFTQELDSAEHFFIQARKHLLQLEDESGVAIINIGIAAIQLKQGRYNHTIKTLTESLSYFEKHNDYLNAAKCYSNMSAAFAELEKFDKAIEYNEKALEVFEQEKHVQFQLITLPNLAAQYLKKGDTLKAITINLKAEKLALAGKNRRSLSIIYNNLGSAYLETNKQKAQEYLEKTIEIKKELGLKNGIEVAQGNLGYLHLKSGDYQTALGYYLLVEKQVAGKQLVFAYDQIQKCYKGLNQHSKALQYAEISRSLNDSILSVENRKVFNEIQTKYETQKKENEILELQSKNMEAESKRFQNKILLYISLGIIVFILLLAYVAYNNAKRKRLLIQQEMKLKTQELIEQLKTQELNGIDAIINAQEKERARMANDLHDNLGSRIATLKLYIHQVEQKQEKEEKTELLNKLKVLANETYSEVRKIAHNKMAGALISKGLIPSMKIIAHQISNSGKLQVNVVNINVKQRVQNNIELQVFRIVQELLTNVIKHANASEANIQFSEDENKLSVMIEDNGRGFNTNDTPFGFGLTNIENRIEAVSGDIVIDSSINNGTTVILNIPLCT